MYCFEQLIYIRPIAFIFMLNSNETYIQRGFIKYLRYPESQHIVKTEMPFVSVLPSLIYCCSDIFELRNIIFNTFYSLDSSKGFDTFFQLKQYC